MEDRLKHMGQITSSCHPYFIKFGKNNMGNDKRHSPYYRSEADRLSKMMFPALISVNL